MKLYAPAVVLGLCIVSSRSVSAADVIHLNSTPSTIHRGILSPDLPPVLTIRSGQIVEIDTVSHGGLQGDPVENFAAAAIPASEVLPDAVAIAHMRRPDPTPGQPPPLGFGGHVLTGPIYIDGAEPGDMLEVRIIKVTPRVAYGVNNAGSGGAAPGMLPKSAPGQSPGKIIKYDIAKKTVNFAADVHFPMRPFMGIMAVAPPETVSSKAPGRFGGNMDFEKLQSGSTLYLPVLVKGALFVTGDSHAGQGDGEVSGNALEASMTPTLQFIVHKGSGGAMVMPYAEDAANYYILGMDPSLNEALANSVKETVKFSWQAVRSIASGCLFALLHGHRFWNCRGCGRKSNRVRHCTESLFHEEDPLLGIPVVASSPLAISSREIQSA
jgi:acetamidase/formamidase